MTTLTIPVLWCVLQVTLVGLLTAGLYLAVRRFSPASSASVLLTGLVVAALLAVTAASPWPSWARQPLVRQAPPVADADTAAHEVPLPRGAEMQPIAEGPASTPDATRDRVGTSRDATGAQPADTPGTVYFDRFLYGFDAMLLEAGRDASGSVVINEPMESKGVAWPVYAGAVFGLAAVIGVLRFVIGWWAVRRQVARSRVLNVAALDELCHTLRGKLGCRRPVELRESAELATAATVGWRRPVILLPAAWATWTANERRAVLAHELAHVTRGHFAAWLIAQTGLVLHFYHPLIHWLASRLRLEQEYEADALAARLTGGPHPYLQTLARLALHQSDTPLRWPARAFLPTHRTFLRRIEMLRQSRQPWKPSLLSRTLSMIAILCGGVFAAGLRGAQSETPNGDAAQSEPAEKDASSRTRRHRQQHALEKQAAIALHGTWEVVHRFHNDVIRPIAPGDYYYWTFDAAKKRVLTNYKLDGNKHPRTAEGELPPKTRFSINPTTQPKELTIYDENLLLQTIYELNGNDLRIAYYGRSEIERPDSFDFEEVRKNGSPLLVKTLRKVVLSKQQDVADTIGGTNSKEQDEIAAVDEQPEPAESPESLSYRMHLVASGPRSVADPHRLPDLTNEVFLALHSSRVTDSDLRHLADFKRLIELTLCDTSITGSGLSVLSETDELERLSLLGPSVTDAWLNHLPRLSKLKRLVLAGNAITDDGLQNLRKVPNLEALMLEDLPIGDSGLSILEHLPRLTSLTLRQTNITDEGLQYLRHLPNLERLFLKAPEVNGPGLVHVRDLKKLSSLQFSGEGVTNEWLHNVEPLRNITWLELHSTQVTSDGLAAIREWKKLKQLYLNQNPIDDNVVDHLQGLFRLQNVELNSTHVTPAGAEKLRNALPDASISARSSRSQKAPGIGVHRGSSGNDVTETEPRGSVERQTSSRDAEVAEALNAIEVRLKKLQSLVVDYERIDIYTPIAEAFDAVAAANTARALAELDAKKSGNPIESATPMRFEILKGTQIYDCRFKCLNGMRRFDREIEKGLNQYPTQKEIYAYLSDHFERFWEQPLGTMHGDRRAKPSVSPELFTIDLALGLRVQGETTWITAEFLKACDVEFEDEHRVVLRINRWKGKPNPEITHQWTFDRRFGYALVAYSRTVNGIVAQQMTMENLRDVDGLRLPELITYRVPNSDYGRVVQSILIRVDTYRIDDPENTPESYPIEFPKETQFATR